MPNQTNKETNDYIVDAYAIMLERVHELVDKAEHATVPKLGEVMEIAKDKAVTLGELSREEAEKVAIYVERDVQDAAEFLVESGDELQDWLRFDLQMVEERFLEWFSAAADKTSLQLKALAEQARQAPVYEVDEVVGPGTLVCDDCGKAYQLIKPTRIQPCSMCGGRIFGRRSGDSPTVEDIDLGDADGG